MSKSKKITIALSCVFLAIALGLFLWGGYMQGWDIKGWFTTPQAYLIYALVVVFALAIGFFIVNSRS